MAQSKTVHPQDRTRFIKLGLVIFEELTPLMQDILQNEISPNQISNQVSRQNSLFQKLRAEQITLIQNAHNDGYKQFDITLLYTLLRNLKCLKITAPTQGWGTSQMPGIGETTLGDDIERIRLIRNKVIGHAAMPSLSETEFQEHWSNISDICARIQTLLGKNYVQSLQAAGVRAIDVEIENTYLEKIKNLCFSEKSMRELLQEVIQDRAPSVEETVRIEAKNPRNKIFAEILTETSISILNDLKNSITEMTADSDIEQLYELIEEFIRENKEGASILASIPFFEELKQKITRHAYLRKSKMQTLARHFRFILRLRKVYGAEVESSKGSLLLTLNFSSERGYDLYMQDFERGEIGKLIQNVLLYPPYLANFQLHAEDLMIYLNDHELTEENNSPVDMKLEEKRRKKRSTSFSETALGNIFSCDIPTVVQIGAGVAVFGTFVVTGIFLRKQSVGKALLLGGFCCAFGTGIAKGIRYIRRLYDRPRHVEDSCLLPKPWRLIHETETDISKIKTHYLRKICRIQCSTHTDLNILLLGQAECGKSSFINACLTALKQDGEICVDATVLKGTSGSVTKKLQAYNLDVRDGDKQIKLPVRLFDCRGLFDTGKGVTTKDIKYMCAGHIKDRYTINPVAHIEPEDPKFRGNPGEKDKMHCVVYVLDAQNSDQFVLKSVEKQFDVIKEHISQSNVPQVILLTKVDLLGVKRIGKMFYDKRVKECCENASAFFGLPLLSVLPQANYSEEFIPDNEKDCITMVNTWTILKRARDYAQNMSDETGSESM